jgi:hypothetical protein
MADSADVEAAIVGVIVSALYPNGTTAASIVSAKISVDRGWPTEADVRTAVGAGTQLIRVHAVSGMSRDAERYLSVWQCGASQTTTLTATLAGHIVTIGGTVTAGEIIAVLSGGIAYTHLALATDTLTTIAASLAASVPGASATGAVLTLPATGALQAVDAVSGSTASLEVGRQKQVFSISVWATTPALRDSIFSALMPGVAANFRLTMPDGSVATRMGMQTGGPNDIPSRANVWARDLRVTWDYPIVQSMASPPMAAGVLVIAPAVTPAAITTIYSV